jgi:hypothetical protein
MNVLKTIPRLLLGLLLLFAAVSLAMAQVEIKSVVYKGWKNNLQISNGSVELIITLDVGPRVIRYGFVGGENLFKEFAEQIGKSGETEWQARGGHRLWHAPEDLKRTYELDNAPIKYEKLGNSGVRVIQPVEPNTRLQKEMDITLEASGTQVAVVHRLRNTGMWDVELAPWALTMMAPGGTEIIPLPAKIPHPQGLLPNSQIITWPYTDMSDARWRWGAKYITFSQDKTKGPNKIGMAHKLGWVAYLLNGNLFVKGFGYEEGRHYTDNGSNFETFSNQDFLEIETLGPLQKIEPGKAIEHIERWWLLKGISSDTSDVGIEKNIRSKIEALIK